MQERTNNVQGRIEIGIEEIRGFLASPAGRRLRRALAFGLLTGSTVLFRIPGLRRYPLIRALQLLGGAALVVRFAEALRDWEPVSPAPIALEARP